MAKLLRSSSSAIGDLNLLVQFRDGGEVLGHGRAKLIVEWRRSRAAADADGEMRGFTSLSPSLVILLSIPSQANPTSSLPPT
ncbi:unnamed protein product [Linum trigynum]|uniref:Uncharacterized protein n=1 Tax=Linum trigynum TaxID=586398 RepID=A0AAV2GSU7_9ROSI